MKTCLRRSFLLVPLLVAFAACSKKPADAPAGGTPPIQTTPAIDAKLVAADKKDGAEDKVVHKCAGCALGMDGKAELGLKVGAYQMHFCSEKCLDRYKKDAIGELGKLDVK